MPYFSILFGFFNRRVPHQVPRREANGIAMFILDRKDQAMRREDPRVIEIDLMQESPRVAQRFHLFQILGVEDTLPMPKTLSVLSDQL